MGANVEDQDSAAAGHPAASASPAMSDQQQGDYPSPTASQSGPYPHRPTAASSSSSVAADAQLAHQLLQATEHAPQGDYGRSQVQQHPSQQPTDVQAMPWGNNGTPQQQHAMAAPAPPQQAAHQYAQFAPDMQQQMAHGQESPGGDDEHAKKKQKTSRACDECRRKKIKCDGDGEKPGYKCANCLRTNADCLYTKPAQKRGPSRGYIRELSDRVASLEELRVGMSPMTPQNPSSIFADSTDSHGIKRTHSISEHGNSEALKTPYSATTPSVAPFARMGQANHDGVTAQVHFKMSLPTLAQPLTPVERNELTTFIDIAQSRLPLLPDDIKDSEHLLDAAAGPIRDTFFRCLKAMNALPASSDRSLYKQAYTSALELAQRPESISLLANVVHLQICVLLLYISGTYGPIDPKTVDEPNEKILYGTATGIAGVLGITGDTPVTNDMSDDLAVKHGRRAYGIFHCLSVWNSLAHGHSMYASAQDFSPDAIDGKAAVADTFLLSAMVPDLVKFQAKFSKKQSYTEVGSLFFDGVLLGLGVMRTDVDKLDVGVLAAKACLDIFRVVAESSGKMLTMHPLLLQSAVKVVQAYGQDSSPFHVVGHHTLGLATRILILAARHTETRTEAAAALTEILGLLDTEKLLQEDGWRLPIEMSIRAALEAKPKDKLDAISCIDIVHGGWMNSLAG